MSRRLDQLLAGIGTAPSVELAGLTLDSRQVVPGGAFVALPGHSTHGLCFAEEAKRRGAQNILFEPPVPSGVEVPGEAIPVPGLREHLGRIASRFHGAPSESLRLIGVTGTNGKTSIVQMLAQVLSTGARRAGSIGTLGCGLHGDLHEGDRTTPDVIAVHAALAAMRDAGADDVAMEVSSHALDQGRVDAVHFDVAVFTNLTRDHLDYHGSMAAYGEAKQRLFSFPDLKAAVINLDDAFAAQLLAVLPEGVKTLGVSSRGAVGAALRATAIDLSPVGIGFELDDGARRVPVKTRLLGRFNIDNLLSVAGVLMAFDWDLAQVAEALEGLEPVAGRMSRLGGDAATPLVVVDYAHTPDALEQALTSLRGHTRGKLICVFGCGGERDTGKRPQMADVAERCADTVIVTDDNPRGESGDAIVAGILAGFAVPDSVRVQRDRAAAIADAIAFAQPGDTVLIAGKGHELYQEIGGQRHPFDDREVARRALEARS